MDIKNIPVEKLRFVDRSEFKSDKKFETKPVIEPTKNPVSPPKHTPAIITSATTGLNCGNIKNAALPATAMAHSTLITTSSLAFGFLPSNIIQKGIIVSKITSKLIK